MQDKEKIFNVIKLAENITKQLGIKPCIATLDDITPQFYVSCLEKICISLPFIRKQSDEEILLFVIDSLENSLGVSLPHISPSSIIKKDVDSIQNLLEIFSELIKAQINGIHTDEKEKQDILLMLKKLLQLIGSSTDLINDWCDIDSLIFIKIIEKIDCQKLKGIIDKPSSLNDEENNMHQIISMLSENLKISLSHIKPSKLAIKDLVSIRNLIELLDSLIQGLSKDKSKQSEAERVMIRLANSMLSRLNIDLTVKSINEIDDVVFVALFEALCSESLTGIIRSSNSKHTKIQNVQLVIDNLESNILNTSLHHITGVQIIAANPIAIVNLLEIFSEMMEYFLEIISEASTHSSREGPKKTNYINETSKKTTDSFSQCTTDRTSEVIGYADVSVFLDKPEVKNQLSENQTDNTKNKKQKDKIELPKYVQKDCQVDLNASKVSSIDKSTQYTPRSPDKEKPSNINGPNLLETSKKTADLCEQFYSKAKDESKHPNTYQDYLQKYYGKEKPNQFPDKESQESNRTLENELGDYDCTNDDYSNDELIINLENEIDKLKAKLLKITRKAHPSENYSKNMKKSRHYRSSVLLPKSRPYDMKRCRSVSPESMAKNIFPNKSSMYGALQPHANEFATAKDRMYKSLDGQKSKAQEYAKEIENRQQCLLNIMKKNVKHKQNLRDINDRKRLNLCLQNCINAKKSQSARIKKYYDEFHLQDRARMLGRKSREEIALRRLLEDGLSLQKEHVREAAKYANDKRKEFAVKQKIELESIENYYRDQFNILGEAIEKNKNDSSIQDKAQNQLLRNLKQELRRKLEREIKDLQLRLWYEKDDDMAFQQVGVNKINHNMQKYRIFS